MSRPFERQTLLTLKGFLSQQLYDAVGQKVPTSINRELTRVVDQRLRDIYSSSSQSDLVEQTIRKTLELVEKNYKLIPRDPT